MGVEQGKPYIVPLTALLGSLCSISRMFLIHAPIIWNLDTEPSFTLTTKIKRPSVSKTAAFTGMILSLYIRSHVVAAAVIISSRAQPASGEFWHIGGLLPKTLIWYSVFVSRKEQNPFVPYANLTRPYIFEFFAIVRFLSFHQVEQPTRPCITNIFDAECDATISMLFVIIFTKL